MQTTSVPCGKPDAGKPHVRVNAGEVASAKTRRGSLRYSTKTLGLGAAVLAAGVRLSLEAVTLTHSDYADDAAAGAALVSAVAGATQGDEVALTAGRWLLSRENGSVNF